MGVAEPDATSPHPERHVLFRRPHGLGRGREWRCAQDDRWRRHVDGENAGTTAPLRSVHFVDAHTGWAIGGRGIIFKTTDGSETLVGAKGFWRLAFFGGVSN